MEAQEITIDQPFHGAYEKFIEITTHLSGEAFGETTHSAIEGIFSINWGRPCICQPTD